MILNNLPPKVALIGGNGFIGNALYRDFVKSGLQIIPTSRNVNNLENNFIEFDIFNEETWGTLINEYQPNTVICTAWETEHSKYWQSNSNFDYAKAIINFANVCFKTTVNHFICLGSCSEYGLSPGKCHSLSTPLNPQDPYSKSKVLASIELEAISKKFNKRANWIRLFQPYGLKEKPERLIPSLIKDMSMGKLINLNNPYDSLDFTHIDDVASAIKLIALGDYSYHVDIGSGVATSIYDLAIKLSDMLNFPSEKIFYKHFDPNQNRVAYVDPVSEIFLGAWRPKYNLYEGLLTLIN